MRAENRPNADYIQLVQKDVTAGMRGVLVDWLVEVAEEYKLLPNTLFSTVSCIDRFLSCQCINRSKLQLLGVSCMLAASYVFFSCLCFLYCCFGSSSFVGNLIDL